MKKKILILIMGLLLVGVNVFAEGDLIVNGKLAVGTTLDSTRKVLIYANPSAGQAWGLRTEVNTNGTGTGHNFWGADFNVNLDSASGVDFGRGINLFAGHDTAGTGGAGFSTLSAGVMELRLGARSRTVSGTDAIALNFRQVTTGDNSTIYNVSNLYGFYYHVDDYELTSATTNITNYRPIYISDPQDPYFNPTTGAQIWLDKLTAGTTNYGIVLNGEGAGSDVVFGDSGGTRPRIYSESGFIYADDAFGSHTKISPHDPETGEWVYYSKNLKTGKVVKVNMEKLVKAVEKITGEIFMIETIEEVE